MKKYNFKTKLFSNSSESNKLSFATKQQHPKGFEFPNNNKIPYFQGNWYDKFPWLHNNIEQDAAFCYVYMLAKKIR